MKLRTAIILALACLILAGCVHPLVKPAGSLPAPLLGAADQYAIQLFRKP